MMVKSADTTDFDWSRGMGNRLRDALNIGELSAREGVTTPSQAPATEKV
jgi:hypothetical protein